MGKVLMPVDENQVFKTLFHYLIVDESYI